MAKGALNLMLVGLLAAGSVSAQSVSSTSDLRGVRLGAAVPGDYPLCPALSREQKTKYGGVTTLPKELSAKMTTCFEQRDDVPASLGLSPSVIANLPHVPGLGTWVAVRTHQGRIGSIEIPVLRENFAVLHAALVDKFGRPSVGPERGTIRRGSNQVYAMSSTWHGAGAILSIEEQSPDSADFGTIRLMSADYMKSLDAAHDKQVKQVRSGL